MRTVTVRNAPDGELELLFMEDGVLRYMQTIDNLGEYSMEIIDWLSYEGND